MKRKLLFYLSLMAGVGVVLWACRREQFGTGDPNAVEPTLTINEARDFFEYQFSEMSPFMTKVTGDRPVGMLPGDFTPLWDKARIGANREMDGADVPIDPKYIFVAVFNRVNERGDTIRHTVDVTQKLVVKKWRDTEEYEAFCYIASIVPTPEYYARHKNVARDFQYAGSKGNFSGFVVYRTLAGKLVGIDNYENGRRTRHDYFSRITPDNQDSVLMVAHHAIGDIDIQGGTATTFRMGMEDDDICGPYVTDPVICKPGTNQPSGYCSQCGSYGGCSCWWPDSWGDHSGSGGGGNTGPDYNDSGNTSGGGGDGGNGSNPSTSNTPSVSTVFDVQGLTESQKSELNCVLGKLADIGISKQVLTQLMAKGKIILKTGSVPGHENSFAVYTIETNTITINWDRINQSSNPLENLRNSVIEETFHAYQYKVYGNLFDLRCYEFEAKVYGTIVINRYDPSPIGIHYLNPMKDTPYENKGIAFAWEIKIMTNNFAHNIDVADMQTLYQNYGDYCTRYPAGDPNWEFQALPGLPFNQ